MTSRLLILFALLLVGGASLPAQTPVRHSFEPYGYGCFWPGQPHEFRASKFGVSVVRFELVGTARDTWGVAIVGASRTNVALPLPVTGRLCPVLVADPVLTLPVGPPGPYSNHPHAAFDLPVGSYLWNPVTLNVQCYGTSILGGEWLTGAIAWSMTQGQL